MPVELSLDDFGDTTSVADTLTLDDFEPTVDLSKVKISPYEQTVSGPFGERLKPESGMESGTEFTAALAGIPGRVAGAIQDITEPKPTVSEYTVPKENVALVPPSIKPPTTLTKTTVGETAQPMFSYDTSPEARRTEFFAGLQRPAVALPRVDFKSDNAALQTIQEIANFAIGVPEFFETPLGVLTMGVGSQGKAGATLVRRLFLADMLKNLAQQTPQLLPWNFSKLNQKEKIQALVNVGGSALFAGMLGSAEIPKVSEPFLNRTAPEPGVSPEFAPPVSREAPAPMARPFTLPPVSQAAPAPMTAPLPVSQERPVEGYQLPSRTVAEPGRSPATQAQMEVVANNRPAVRTMPDALGKVEVLPAETKPDGTYETHDEVIKREGLKTEDIDKREFVDQSGNEKPRTQTAAEVESVGGTTKVPGEAHSTDVNKLVEEPVTTPPVAPAPEPKPKTETRPVEFDPDKAKAYSLDGSEDRYDDINGSGYYVTVRSVEGENQFQSFDPNGKKIGEVSWTLQQAQDDINSAIGAETVKVSEQTRTAREAEERNRESQGEDIGDAYRYAEQAKQKAKAEEPKPVPAGETVLPFNAKNLESTMGLTPEQANAAESIAWAMGLDTSKISLVKGGTPKEGALRQLSPEYQQAMREAIASGDPVAYHYQKALQVQQALDKNKLFWKLNPEKSWLEDNAEYWKSVDPDLLCQRSEGTDAAVHYLKQVLGDKYDVSMAWEVFARANQEGLQTPCPQCYVYSARAKPGGAMQKKYVVGVAGYNGELLRFKDANLDQIVRRALRHYSSTDFKAEHIPGLIAEVAEASKRGVPLAAYTKQPDFARIFGPSGFYINLSVGRNELVGMNLKEALALRKKYRNASTVYVSFTDAETIAALKNPNIDHVIPWHGSGQALKELRSKLNDPNLVDYTKFQNETVNGLKSERQIKEWEHGGDLATYLRLVEENGLTKKFPQIYDALKAQGRENLYMKLIGPEYGKHGGAYPYEPVKANIDYAAIEPAMKSRLKTRLASTKDFIGIARGIVREVNRGEYERGDAQPLIQQGPLKQTSETGTTKAAVEFSEGGKALIRALESPDISSGVHELAHTARRFLFDRTIPEDRRSGITDQHIRAAEEWSGAADGVWTTEAEEKFARGFERYLRDGKAPNALLADLFARFKEWLSMIYRKVTGSQIDVKISKEMRGVYDALVSRGDKETGRPVVESANELERLTRKYEAGEIGKGVELPVEEGVETPFNLLDKKPSFRGEHIAVKLEDGRVFWSHGRMHATLSEELMKAGIIKNELAEIKSTGFVENGKYKAGGEGEVDWQAAKREYKKSLRNQPPVPLAPEGVPSPAAQINFRNASVKLTKAGLNYVIGEPRDSDMFNGMAKGKLKIVQDYWKAADDLEASKHRTPTPAAPVAEIAAPKIEGMGGAKPVVESANELERLTRKYEAGEKLTRAEVKRFKKLREEFVPRAAEEKAEVEAGDWTSATAEEPAPKAKGKTGTASLVTPPETTELAAGIPMPKFANRKMSELDRATAKHSARIQKSFDEARRAQKEIQRVAPNDRRQGAISVWLEAKGDIPTLQAWASSAKGKLFRRAAEDAQRLSPEEIAVARKVRAAYDVLSTRGQAYDVLKNHRDAYVTHVWDVKKPGTGLGWKVMKEKFKFSKARTFNNFFEGDQAGFVPKTLAIGKLLPAYLHEMNQVIADRQFVKDLPGKYASDGRPLIAARGRAEEKVDPTTGQSAFLVFPKSMRKAKDAAGNAVDQSDYRIIEGQPALNAWRWIEEDSNGNPIFIKGDIALHPEAYRRVNAMIGKSALRSWAQESVGGMAQVPRAIARGIDTAQSAMKREMFGFLAPFHQVQEGTHAVGHLVNPFFGLEKIDMRRPDMQDAAAHGLMLLPDRVSASRYLEGVGTQSSFVSRALRRATSVGRVLSDVIDGYQDYLFHQYIPALKFKTYEAMVRRNLRTYRSELAAGEVTPADVKFLSAEQANAAYGHLNYALLDRNPTIQHLIQLSLLAPDFLEARARFAGQAVKGITSKVGHEQFKAVAILAAAQAGTAYVLSELLGTPYDPKHPFEVVYNGRRYAMRSVPEDIYSLLKDTRQFIYGRVNPLTVKGAVQLGTGLNYRGEKVDAIDTITELAAGYIPITARGLPGLRSLTETGRTMTISPLEQLWGSLGLRISRYSPITEMHKKAAAWMDEQKIARPKGSYPVSRYQQLRYALEDADMPRARQEYLKLRETMTPDKIRTGFEQSIKTPFTQSAALDQKFARSLTPEEREFYRLALRTKEKILLRFNRLQ